MIKERSAKAYCCEDVSKIENYDKAIADNTQTWDLHHRREIDEHKTPGKLIEEGLYFSRPATELIFLTHGDHSRLHKQNLSAEAREKMSEAKQGEKNPNFKKHQSDAAREKNSEAHRGRLLSAETIEKIRAAKQGEKNPNFGKHPSAETIEKLSKAVSSLKWWNNGQICTRARECPGPEWQKGRL